MRAVVYKVKFSLDNEQPRRKQRGISERKDFICRPSFPRLADGFFGRLPDKKAEKKQKQDLQLCNELELEQAFKELKMIIQGEPSPHNAEKVFKAFFRDIPRLVKKDNGSRAFFLPPVVEELILLLEKIKDKKVQKKTAFLKAQLFEYIQFQNTLADNDSQEVSFYFLKEGL